ncbi:hypothetical protein GmHk_05G012745 [Glycine max]|nr:hypothetical protein GmHk_05G012745 [Glycine max]
MNRGAKTYRVFDLDDTSSDEDDEEANICLMADTTLEESKSDQEDEVNFNDPESLKKAYHKILSNSFILSKSKICLEIETITKEESTLLKNSQELENKLKDLQKDLKELNELHDYQNEEKNDMWIECAQAYKDY